MTTKSKNITTNITLDVFGRGVEKQTYLKTHHSHELSQS